MVTLAGLYEVLSGKRGWWILNVEPGDTGVVFHGRSLRFTATHHTPVVQ